MVDDRKKSTIGCLFFCGLLFWNISYHSMWVDELQAWSLTRASSDLFDLFIRLRPESHPGLWYLVLWFPSRLTDDPHIMQIVTAGIGAASLSLIWMRSPFSFLERALLSSGFQLAYNLTALSRSYSLGILIVLSFVAYRKEFARRPWVGWLLLGLLANVHLYFAAASFCLAIDWLRDENRSVPLLQGASLYLLGMFFSLLTMLRLFETRLHSFEHLPLVAGLTLLLGLALWLCSKRLPELTTIILAMAILALLGLMALGWYFRPGLSAGAVAQRLLSSLSVLGAGIVPLFHPLKTGYWNLALPPVLGSCLFGAATWVSFVLLRKRTHRLCLLALQTSFMLAVFSFWQPGTSWHAGVLYLLLVGYLWLAKREDSLVGPVWLLPLFILPQSLAGAHAMVASKTRGLSASQDTAIWLREQELDQETIYGYDLFPTLGVATYLRKPFYFLEAGEYLSYNPWGKWLRHEYLPHMLGEHMKKAGRQQSILVVPVRRKQQLAKAFAANSRISCRVIHELNHTVTEHYVVLRVTRESGL